MKTIKEWFNTLEEPYKTQALKNTKADILSEKAEDLSDALLRAFIWIDSPEGHEYWDELEDSLTVK